MRFDLWATDGSGTTETVNLEVLLSKLSSSKDATVRAHCLEQLNNGLNGAVARVAALSLSSVAGSWLIENKERSCHFTQSSQLGQQLSRGGGKSIAGRPLGWRTPM